MMRFRDACDDVRAAAIGAFLPHADDIDIRVLSLICVNTVHLKKINPQRNPVRMIHNWGIEQ